MTPSVSLDTRTATVYTPATEVPMHKRIVLLIVAAAAVFGLAGCSLFNQAPVVVVTWYPRIPIPG